MKGMTQLLAKRTEELADLVPVLLERGAGLRRALEHAEGSTADHFYPSVADRLNVVRGYESSYNPTG